MGRAAWQTWSSEGFDVTLRSSVFRGSSRVDWATWRAGPRAAPKYLARRGSPRVFVQVPASLREVGLSLPRRCLKARLLVRP